MKSASWFTGRRLWLALASWVAAVVVSYFFWWVGTDGPWAPFDDPYYARLLSLAPALLGALGFYGVLPGLLWLDRQSPRRVQLRNTMAIILLVLAFSAIPPLLRWLFTLSDAYTIFIPKDRLAEGGSQDSLAEITYFWHASLEIMLVLGCTCLSIAVFGRLLGPLSGPAWYAILLVLQGQRMAPRWILRADEIHSWHSAALSITVVILGVGTLYALQFRRPELLFTRD